MNFTYILRCNDGSLYTGWTNDLEKRLGDHNAGKGAKYTKGNQAPYPGAEDESAPYGER